MGLAPAVKNTPVAKTAPVASQLSSRKETAVNVNTTTVQAAVQQRTSEKRHTGENNYLSFTNEGRIEKVVRMGSVMIKLLKRYGITDQEIAEGVAAYARKHQQAMAS